MRFLIAIDEHNERLKAREFETDTGMIERTMQTEDSFIWIKKEKKKGLSESLQLAFKDDAIVW